MYVKYSIIRIIVIVFPFIVKRARATISPKLTHSCPMTVHPVKLHSAERMLINVYSKNDLKRVLFTRKVMDWSKYDVLGKSEVILW